MKVLLGFSVAAYGGNVGAHVDINPELSECSGFVMLEHLLYYHYEKPQCYLAMLALLVGQPVLSVALVDNFTLDLIWSHVFGLSLSRLALILFLFEFVVIFSSPQNLSHSSSFLHSKTVAATCCIAFGLFGRLDLEFVIACIRSSVCRDRFTVFL